MEDLRPSRPARVDLVTAGDQNQSDNSRPRRHVNPKPTRTILPDPLLDPDADKKEKHQLDEMA